MEGFSCDRYAMRSRGSCLCNERLLIEWATLARCLLMLTMLYISKTETVSQHYYCTLH